MPQQDDDANESLSGEIKLQEAMMLLAEAPTGTYFRMIRDAR